MPEESNYLHGIDLREKVVLTEEAADKIKKEIGFLPTEEMIKPSGPRIIVKLYLGDDDHFIKKDGTKSALLRPQMSEYHDLLTTCVGMVISMNPCCYQDDKFRLRGPYCRLGDWAIIPRNEGVLMYLKGHPVHIFYDDCVIGTTSDPRIIRKE